MNQDNKRTTKPTGFNKSKETALSQMREARKGKNRLEQALEVILLFNFYKK